MATRRRKEKKGTRRRTRKQKTSSNCFRERTRTNSSFTRKRSSKKERSSKKGWRVKAKVREAPRVNREHSYQVGSIDRRTEEKNGRIRQEENWEIVLIITRTISWSREEAREVRKQDWIV